MTPRTDRWFWPRRSGADGAITVPRCEVVGGTGA